MPPIELNKLITFSVPQTDSVLSENVIEKIQLCLTNLNLRGMPDDWLWHWIVTKDTKTEKYPYIGTLPKRISAYFNDHYGLSLKQNVLAEIGKYATEESHNDLTYTFQFTNDFSWRAGDFGDENSCYFVRSGMPLKVLKDNGVLAACFYSPTSLDKEATHDTLEEFIRKYRTRSDFFNILSRNYGAGRCWIVPNLPSEGMFAVFNGYYRKGVRSLSGDPLLKISRILSTYFSLSYRQVIAYNQGRLNGIIYVNSGRRYYLYENDERITVNKPRAFILGTEEQIAEYPYETTSIELGLKDTSNYYSDEDSEE